MTKHPSAWTSRPLGEVVDVLDSQRVPLNANQRALRPGDVPYYGATGQAGWIDEPLFNEPLVLLGEDGVQFFEASKQKAYLIDGPAWVNNHAHVLRAKSFIERKFLYYWLNTVDYRELANGTTRLKLTQAAMKRIDVPIPALPEQRRIVSTLEDHFSRLDAADSYLRAGRRRADMLVKSILSDDFRGPISPLSALARSAGYGTSSKCVAAGPGPAVVRIPNLVAGAIDLTDEKRVADPSVDVAAAMLDAGDLLIVRTNGSVDLIGRSAVVQDGVDAAFASYLIRYRLRQDLVRPEWVQAMLSAPQTRRRIERLAASSAGQYNLSLSKLNPLGIPVPPLQEQDRRLARLADVKNDLARLRSAISSSAVRGSALRRSLLTAAFSGHFS